MITDVKFGKSRSRWINDKTVFYVYHNSSGATMIGPAGKNVKEDWDVPSMLSHETLHKVILKIAGRGASRGLDEWCKACQWIFVDNSGICF